MIACSLYYRYSIYICKLNGNITNTNIYFAQYSYWIWVFFLMLGVCYKLAQLLTAQNIIFDYQHHYRPEDGHIKSTDSLYCTCTWVVGMFQCPIFREYAQEIGKRFGTGLAKNIYELFEFPVTNLKQKERIILFLVSISKHLVNWLHLLNPQNLF